MEVKFKWNPHFEQRRVLTSDCRFRTVKWGRRSGKTELAIVDEVKFALENPGSICWWIAPSYQQANDYGFDRMLKKIPDVLIKSVKRSSPREIELVNGSIIIFKSAEKPGNLKGGGVDYMVCDEAARYPNLVWQEYIRPTLSDTMGKALLISTPLGKNWFKGVYDRGNDPDKPQYASFSATSYVNPEVLDSEIDQVKGELPQRVFAQEYLAEFQEDSGEVFIDIPTEKYRWESKEGVAPFSTGCDFARHHDYTVIITLDNNGRIVYWHRSQPEKWSEIEDIIVDIYRQYGGIVHVDATRDNKIVDDLMESDVAVDPVKFSNQSKKTLIENLAGKLEKKEIVLPDNLEILQDELSAYEYDITSHNNVRYHKPKDGHDDSVDSLALAAKRTDYVNATWGS